jgi:hypothetical protein
MRPIAKHGSPGSEISPVLFRLADTRPGADKTCSHRALSAVHHRGLTTSRDLRVTSHPRHTMLPLRKVGESLTIWHFHLRQTLGVEDLVFLDNFVFVK